jgi:aspartate/methionine/tyrosine aminotransferase
MKYKRMPIEIESPEQRGYDSIKYNLTESSISDQELDLSQLSLDKILTCYGNHLGNPKLRELIANQYTLLPEHVLITAGAAAGLFIVSTALLDSSTGILVMHPNYGTNYETPRAIGSPIVLLKLSPENHYQIDVAEVIKLIQLHPEIKLISITNPHNPTGIIFSKDIIIQLIQIAEEKNLYLLIDETYADLWFDNDPKPNYAVMSNQVIIVSSFSKAYGIPGIRIGWIVTRNPLLNEMFLAAKEQIYICNSVLDEEVALRFLEKKHQWWNNLKQEIENKRNLAIKWLTDNQNYFKFTIPLGGVVCYPEIVGLTNKQVKQFYNVLNNRYETFVGPGHWFEMDKRFFRIGYGWPSLNELNVGLHNIIKALNEAKDIE